MDARSIGRAYTGLAPIAGRGSRRPTYPRAMAFVKALVVIVALVVGVPLAIVGLTLVGPVGWIGAAVILPLATLGVILWLGRPQPGDGERPPDDGRD
jgi:hypothetical protein